MKRYERIIMDWILPIALIGAIVWAFVAVINSIT